MNATATLDTYAAPAHVWRNRRLRGLCDSLRALRNHSTMYEDALYLFRASGMQNVRRVSGHNPAQAAAIRYLMRHCPLAFSCEQVAYWRRRWLLPA